MGVLSDRQMESIGNVIVPFDNELNSKEVISHGLSSYGYDIRLGYKFKVFTNTFSTEVDPKKFNDKAFINFDLTPEGHVWLRMFKDMRSPRYWKCKKCGMEVSQLTTNGDTEDEGDILGYVGMGGEVLEESDCPLPEKEKFVRIPPNSFALAESLEIFNVPRDVVGVIFDKSSYRRCGILVGGTVLEPEWKGKLTIEISNTTPLPARVYAGEGIAQVMFIRSDEKTECLMRHLIKKTPSVESIESFFSDWKQSSCRTSYQDRKGRYQNQSGLTLPFVSKE